MVHRASDPGSGSGSGSERPRELLVLRHGHAAPHGSVEPDFDRPLDERGAADAAWMARWAAGASDALPGLVVASPARRARETAEGFCRGADLDPEAIRWDERIYDARVSDLVEVLADVPSAPRRVMLVGHNPGFENLAAHLAYGTPEGGRVRLATAAAARLAMPEDWSRLPPGAGELLEVVRPPKA